MFKGFFSTQKLQFLRRKRVIIMCGLPGCGKSTLAKKLSRYLKAEIISSDKIRKREHNLVRFHYDADRLVTNLRPKYYARIFKEVRKYITNNQKVIIDASNMDKERINLINKIGLLIDKQDMLIIILKTPKPIIAKRMRKLQKRRANAKEDYFSAWQRVYGYFEKHLKEKTYFWPRLEEGVEILAIKNA